MAEGKGFEPPKGISSFNDLANRRLQPLGHPSAKGQSLKWAKKAPRRMHPLSKRGHIFCQIEKQAICAFLACSLAPAMTCDLAPEPSQHAHALKRFG